MFEEVSSWVSENFYLVIRYVVALVIVSVFYYISKFASRSIARVRIEVKPEVVHNLERAVRLAILVVGLLIALSAIGVDLGGVLVAAGFAGLVVGLAAQQTLSNLFAGLALIVEGRVKVGDAVRIGSDGGVVESVGIMSTQIRLWSGEILTIPNSSVMNSPIYNFSRQIARRVEVSVGVSYASDVDRAVKIVREVLWRNELVLAEPEPAVLVDSLGESSVSLRVMFWVPTQEFWTARGTILRDIKIALESEGVEIPYPQRVVWIKKGVKSQSTSTPR
ncbi:MAG: mechanosensitive ion channel family protein [Sulfolobales archaeon]|nr:mechanosensitive ion channel family protein [Sulfolobales archaeon]MDW8082798.1 mechanosensitive ion channel family protein [Sulfolobales archaeon]